jgi:hypothetical protein
MQHDDAGNRGDDGRAALRLVPEGRVRNGAGTASVRVVRSGQRPGEFMDSQIAQLVARITRLEDIEEITRLKAEYCNAMDGGWDRPAHDADRAA